MLLGWMGADVIRLEGPRGSHSRHVGPFTTATSDPEHSLTFARYNLGKRSVRFDTDNPAGRAAFARIARRASVILDSGEAAEVATRLSNYRELRESHPELIVCTM